MAKNINRLNHSQGKDIFLLKKGFFLTFSLIAVSEKTTQVDAVLRTLWKHSEGSAIGFLACLRLRATSGHKSNRLNMIHKIPAVKKEMPRNGGTTLRMRRYNPLNTAMVPLGNSGVTPKVCGRVKSSLIDMEFEVAYAAA